VVFCPNSDLKLSVLVFPGLNFSGTCIASVGNLYCISKHGYYSQNWFIFSVSYKTFPS